MKNLTTILLFLLFPLNIMAAPAISNVSGTVSNGQTITISGSGFDEAGPTVVIFDDFEKGTNGSTISTAANSAQVSQWDSIAYYGVAPKYSNAYAVSGSLAFRGDQTADYRCRIYPQFIYMPMISA